MLDHFIHWAKSAETLYAVVIGVPGSAAITWIAKAVWRHVRPATPTEWDALAASFRAVSPKLEAIWHRYHGAPRVDWSLYPQEGGTARDRELFQKEAKRASQLFLRGLTQRLRVGGWAWRSYDDIWLDIIATMADPQCSMKLSGRSFGVETTGGVMSDVAGMSVVTCKALAARERPARAATLLALARYEGQRRRLVRAEQEFLAQVAPKLIGSDSQHRPG